MDGVSVTSLPYAMMETRNPAPLFIFVGDVKDKVKINYKQIVMSWSGDNNT